MSAARCRRRRNRMNSQLIGDTLQSLCVNVVHEWSKHYSRKAKKKVLFRQNMAGNVTNRVHPNRVQGVNSTPGAGWKRLVRKIKGEVISAHKRSALFLGF